MLVLAASPSVWPSPLPTEQSVLGMLTAHGAESWQKRQGELTAEVDGQKLQGSDRSDSCKSLQGQSFVLLYFAGIGSH